MWNHDISAAPRGVQVTVTRKVKTEDGYADRNSIEHHVAPLWLATKDGKVHRSYWIPATKTSEGRWAGFSVGSEQPIAWQPFIVPEHPSSSAVAGEYPSVFEDLQSAYKRGVDFACNSLFIDNETVAKLWEFVPKAAYDYADRICPEHPFNPVTAPSQEARTPFGGAVAVTESGAGVAKSAGPAISIIDDVGGM